MTVAALVTVGLQSSIGPASATTCPAPGGVSIPNAATPAGAQFVAYGRGYGHNLGMSQYGAEGAAKLGCTAPQILDTYYHGTHVAAQALQPNVMLTLLNTDPSGHADVIAQDGVITWDAVAAKKTVLQPTGTTWHVVQAPVVPGGEYLVDNTGKQVFWIASNGELRANEKAPGSQPGLNVARVRSFGGASGSTLFTDLQLKWDYTRFVSGPDGMKIWQVIIPTGAVSGVQKYLWGLAEVPVTWPDAALQAQAIAARTYLVNGYWNPTSNAYTIGTTPASQNYTGYAKEAQDAAYGLHWQTAVNNTINQVVLDSSGSTITAMYTSSAGGHTEDKRYVSGGGAFSYLVPLDDSRWDLASDNPNRSWSKGFSKAAVAAIFGLTTITGVTVAPWGSATRINGVTVTGTVNGVPVSHTYDGTQMRSFLGTLSPSMTYAWPLSDMVAPVAKASAGPGATFRWSATDAAPSSGLAGYAVTVQHGATVDYTSASTTATSLTMVGVPGTTYQLTVTAKDRSGNVSTPVTASVAVPLPGTFHAIAPARIVDSRISLGFHGPLGGHAAVTIPVAGAAGSPVPAGATAVVLNVAAVAPTTAGYLSVGPVASTTTSNVSFSARHTSATLVVAQLSPTGTVTINNGGAAGVNVLADVQGYLTPDTTGSTYVPVPSARLVDTRTGHGAPAAIGAGGSTTVQVTGLAGVPAGATGVVVNVTAVGPAAGGYLSVGPALSTHTSVVNFAAGQTVANLALSQLSGTGTISLYNGGSHATQVLVDVQGYLVAGTTGSSYDPIGPARMLDTRTTGGPLPSGGTRTVSIAGATGSAVPSTATAVVLNVTAVNPATTGFLTVGPTSSTTTSNVNFVSGQTVSNLVVAQLSPTGAITVATGGAGTVNVVVDVLGYLAP
jgi:stage II sporulation protein D